jgi:hypothetical protein
MNNLRLSEKNYSHSRSLALKKITSEFSASFYHPEQILKKE